MAPSRMVGGLSQSSASSGIFFQGDGQSQSLINSYLTSSFGGNSTNTISGTARSNLGQGSGDSVGASSLVTDANTDSYMRLPASPLSFTSNNNITVSGSSVIDDPNSHQQGASGSSSFGGSQMGQGHYPLNMGPRVNNSFIQDPLNISHLQKKPRLDIKQEEIMQQQVLHQLLQRQGSMQLQSTTPQLQTVLQQQKLRELQMLQSLSPIQRMQLQQHQQQQQQQQQQQMRQQLQQQNMQQMATMKNPYDTGGVCARRLMQYLYHRQRPADNTIAYWRKFVAEYYAPRSKRRWCLSLYENVGHHALGVFPQASVEAWHCDICGSKSGRGFEATYEVLPRLNEIEFGSGVIDELLFVDLPRERRFANGVMLLEYGKAVQESVYEQLRVVREGQLRVVFTQELKILSWDFCARRHEELVPRKLVAPQVNQLLQVAQKCQSTLLDSGSEGVSSQDLQTNNNMVIAAGRQLAKSLELPSLNDLGFSKRYVRCLQIAEVVNSMKDLVDFCRDNKTGPIDGLKSYPRHSPTPRIPMQRTHEMEQFANNQGLNTDRNAVSTIPISQPRMSNPSMANNHNLLANNRAVLNNYQNTMRPNSFNSNPNSLHQEVSSSFHGTPGQFSESRQNSGFLNSQGGQYRQQGPSSEQHVIQQLMQGAAGNVNAGGPQKTFSGQNVTAGIAPDALRYGNSATSAGNVHGGEGPTLSKSNSFKAPSNSESSAVGGGSNSGFNQKAADIPHNFNLIDDMVPDLPNDFAESDFFGTEFDDNLDYEWKA